MLIDDKTIMKFALNETWTLTSTTSKDIKNLILIVYSQKLE